MKIESGEQAFVPVIIKLETREELQLFCDFFARSPGTVGDLYNLPNDFMYDTYKSIKAVLDARGIPLASKINVTKN